MREKLLLIGLAAVVLLELACGFLLVWFALQVGGAVSGYLDAIMELAQLS
jgi:hypothetical protein